MKFRSTTGEPVSIGLTTGHMAIVGTELTELEPRFHKEAIARGCLPEGVAEDKLPEGGGFDRKKVIADAMTSMMDGDEEGDFNNDGRPNLTALNARVGFTVPREEADAIFKELSEKA